MPALVNAHTHVELSWLAGRVPPAPSMVEWIRRVMGERAIGPMGGAAGGGLGFFIWNSYVGGSYTQIVAGMVTIGIAGYISSAVLRTVGRWITPWLNES